MDTPMLEIRALRAGYGTIDVLHGVNLELQPGQVYALLGPNGAGKTTTLAVCSGQIVPSAGQVLVNGREINGVSSDALARAGVCLVPEGRGIFPNLTVTENLRMATFAGVSFSDVLDKAFTPVVLEVEAASLADHGPMLTSPGEAHVHVLSGEAVLHSQLYAPLRLKAGDGVYFDARSPYALLSAGPGCDAVRAVARHWQQQGWL